MTDVLDRPVDRPADRPQIDPRFARRWIDARREEGRRRLHLLAWIGGGLALVLALAGSLWTPLWQVRHVRVSVAGPVAAARVQAAAGLARSRLMVDVDATAVARHLASIPNLGDARVARHWPGTVTVSVGVRVPVAVVVVALAKTPAGATGAASTSAAAGSAVPRWAEVDGSGRVLAIVEQPPPGLPILAGLGAVPAPGAWMAGSPGAAGGPAGPIGGARVDMGAVADGPDVPTGSAAALAVVNALPSSLRADVTTVTAGPGAALSLVVEPPRSATGLITVNLGDGSQLAAKITALETLLDSADLGGATGMDLSVPTRPAVTGPHG